MSKNELITQPQITVYSSPTCAFCHMAMDYIKQKGYDYTEKDITLDQEALAYVLHTIGQAVTPIITIGKEVIVGFDRPKIDEALKNIPQPAKP